MFMGYRGFAKAHLTQELLSRWDGERFVTLKKTLPQGGVPQRWDHLRLDYQRPRRRILGERFCVQRETAGFRPSRMRRLWT